MREPEIIGRVSAKMLDGKDVTILILRTFREEFDQINGRHYVANNRYEYMLEDGRQVIECGGQFQTQDGDTLELVDRASLPATLHGE